MALKGIFKVEELQTIKKLGTRLQGHPDINKTPGIEAPTGSLGQGLSFANGMALGGRMNDLKFNSYVILGDGELQEGQVWEEFSSETYKARPHTGAIPRVVNPLLPLVGGSESWFEGDENPELRTGTYE